MSSDCERRTLSLARFVITFSALVLMLLALGYVAAGKSGAEKTLIRLVQPIGFGWLLLSSYCVQLTLTSELRKTLAPWTVWFIVMVFTTTPLCAWCVRRLESSVEAYRPERDGPLEAVVVLGGGTHQGPWRAELSGAGDRVMYAAQLYLQNHTRRLITTGDVTPGVSRDRSSPREQTIELWMQLNIPADAIGSLQGINTYQELQSLKQIMGQFKGGRVGVLTSALHLPRAMRLAKAAGIEVVPLAADHLSSTQSLMFLDYIPSAGPLTQLAACQHEFMAQLIGR